MSVDAAVRPKRQVRLRYYQPGDTHLSPCESWRWGHDPADHPDPSTWERAVYEAYARNGSPLYVGRSNYLGHRLVSHSRGSRWWASFTSMVITYLPCAATMHAYEYARIYKLKPRYNRQAVDL